MRLKKFVKPALSITIFVSVVIGTDELTQAGPPFLLLTAFLGGLYYMAGGVGLVDQTVRWG